MAHEVQAMAYLGCHRARAKESIPHTVARQAARRGDGTLVFSHPVIQGSWLRATRTVLSCPHLIGWPPVQAVGVELVDVQHVNGTFDAEMM